MQQAGIAPLPSSVDDRARPCLKNKRRDATEHFPDKDISEARLDHMGHETGHSGPKANLFTPLGALW